MMVLRVEREAARRKYQLEFEQSDRELVVGEVNSLPLSATQLQTIESDSEHVVETFNGGLTASVYHLLIEGVHWTLKRKRPQSRVQNVDGQTSFLNEVQRRHDFSLLQHDAAHQQSMKHIVSTQYASYRQGVILSPWIAGHPIKTFNERTLQQLLFALVQLELHGFMEWDPSPGNILDDGKQIMLFDFGYCYRFNPLTEFHSNGAQQPLFHSVERLETRSLSGVLLAQEQQGNLPAALASFTTIKQLAIEAYQYKYTALKARGASHTVLQWVEGIIATWQRALATPATLEDCYLVEMYRSHLLDVLDDVMGKSCTPTTLQRIEWLQNTLTEHYTALDKLGGLTLFGEPKSQATLLNELTEYHRQATCYQL